MKWNKPYTKDIQVWFHSHEVVEQAKLVYGRKKWEWCLLLGAWWQTVTGKECEGTFWINDSVLYFCCRKGDPFQGPRLSSCLTLRNGLSSADKARDFIGKGHPSGEQEGKWAQENCLPCGLQSPVLGDVLSRFSLINHCGSRSFVVYTLLSQDGSQQGGLWEIGRSFGISCWPFPNSCGWWWLVSSMFLARTSCCKVTGADDYCLGAWPRASGFSQHFP